MLLVMVSVLSHPVGKQHGERSNVNNAQRKVSSYVAWLLREALPSAVHLENLNIIMLHINTFST